MLYLTYHGPMNGVMVIALVFKQKVLQLNPAANNKNMKVFSSFTSIIHIFSALLCTFAHDS